MRLDKYMADAGIGSRSQVKQYLKKGLVTVNGIPQKKPEQKITEHDVVCFRGKQIAYEKYVYYMLHKPAGCVSATKDERQKTVLSYLTDADRNDLFPVGRLDADAEGLLLITNDGPLCHTLLSPVKHVEKTYFVRVRGCVSLELAKIFENGIDIGDEKPTLPAGLQLLKAGKEDSELLITVTEGRFHQVKRMCAAVGHPVLYLKRLSMGPLHLDETLKAGEYRALTPEEVASLKLLDGRGKAI